MHRNHIIKTNSVILIFIVRKLTYVRILNNIFTICTHVLTIINLTDLSPLWLISWHEWDIRSPLPPEKINRIRSNYALSKVNPLSHEIHSNGEVVVSSFDLFIFIFCPSWHFFSPSDQTSFFISSWNNVV